MAFVKRSFPLKTFKQEARIPYINEYEDALGKSDGRQFSEFSNHAKFLTAIQGVAAVGKRPEDWAKRDLLVSASGDDRRNWSFKQLIANNSTFLNQNYDVVKDIKDERIVRSSRAFDYMHRRYLLSILDKTIENTPEQKVLNHAIVCPTSLYQTNDVIPHKINSTRRQNVCLNAWVCPHCYARTLVKAFHLCKTTIPQSNAYALTLISDETPICLNNIESFNDAYRTLRIKVIEIARLMGAKSGILALQVAPLRQQKLIWTCNEAITEEMDFLTLRVATMAVIPTTGESLSQLLTFTESQSQIQGLDGEQLQIDLEKTSSEWVIRMMLVAKSERRSTLHNLSNNNYGLFYWPPIWLCSQEQWINRYWMTKGKKSFQRWGKWAKN
jgi:hypothetical protein